MPRRVPARGRGRETELCIILSQGEVPKAEGVPLQESSVQFCNDVRDPLVSSLSPREQVFPEAKRGAVDRFPLGL